MYGRKLSAEKNKKLLINISSVATLKDNNIAACVSLMPDQISTAFRYSNIFVCMTCCINIVVFFIFTF